MNTTQDMRGLFYIVKGQYRPNKRDTLNTDGFNPDDPNSLPMIKHPGTALSKEFEERLYFNDIYPLDKYCTRIDVLIRNWNRDDSSDHMYYIADQLGENASLELINKTMLKELQSNQTFANRIHIKVANIKYDYQFNIKNKNGGA